MIRLLDNTGSVDCWRSSYDGNFLLSKTYLMDLLPLLCHQHNFVVHIPLHVQRPYAVLRSNKIHNYDNVDLCHYLDDSIEWGHVQ